MMNELQPLIRIFSYMLGTWLVSAGLPAPVADIISNDPQVIALISDALGALVAGGALVWWRIAKRAGWAT